MLTPQRSLHPVLSCCLCTAHSTRFCLLCCQPVPVRRLSCARTAPPTQRSPCAPWACQRQLISTVCKTYADLRALPPRLTPYSGVTVQEPARALLAQRSGNANKSAVAPLARKKKALRSLCPILVFISEEKNAAAACSIRRGIRVAKRCSLNKRRPGSKAKVIALAFVFSAEF